jgi:hypothetical protein
VPTAMLLPERQDSNSIRDIDKMIEIHVDAAFCLLNHTAEAKTISSRYSILFSILLFKIYGTKTVATSPLPNPPSLQQISYSLIKSLFIEKL